MATGLLSYPVCRCSCCVCVCLCEEPNETPLFSCLFPQKWIAQIECLTTDFRRLKLAWCWCWGLCTKTAKEKKEKTILYRVKSVADRFGRSLAMIYVAQRAHIGCTLLHTVSCWKSHRHQKHVTIDRINRAEQFVGTPSCCQGAKHGINTLILVAMFRACMCVCGVHPSSQLRTTIIQWLPV